MARKPVPPTAKINSPFSWGDDPDAAIAAQARAHGLTIRATHVQSRQRLADLKIKMPCSVCFTMPAANGSCNCA